MYLHWFWSIFCTFELSSQSRFVGHYSNMAALATWYLQEEKKNLRFVLSFSIHLFLCNTVYGVSASFRMNWQKSSFTQCPKCRWCTINMYLARNWSVCPSVWQRTAHAFTWLKRHPLQNQVTWWAHTSSPKRLRQSISLTLAKSGVLFCTEEMLVHLGSQ